MFSRFTYSMFITFETEMKLIKRWLSPQFSFSLLLKMRSLVLYDDNKNDDDDDDYDGQHLMSS